MENYTGSSSRPTYVFLDPSSPTPLKKKDPRHYRADDEDQFPAISQINSPIIRTGVVNEFGTVYTATESRSPEVGVYETSVEEKEPEAPSLLKKLLSPALPPSSPSPSLFIPTQRGTVFPEEDIQGKYGSIWNYEFQKYLESTSRDKWIKIQKLAEDFLESAEKYGRIIIEEFDPLLYRGSKLAESDPRIARLTIKPNFTLGGVAGGVKFVHNGILFKFALDWSGIYKGSDEWAMKSAKLEMKAIRCLEWANITGLHFPLYAIIQLNGFSLIAQSLLPISGNDTLCYGSSDGGKTFVCRDKACNSMLLELCEKLNLQRVRLRAISADHSISHAGPVSINISQAGGESVIFQAASLENVSIKIASSEIINHAGPIDLEIHKGRDGRYYAVDVARLMPAERNIPTQSIFAHCLRPSFVRGSAQPLNSDMFSIFTKNFIGYDLRANRMAHVNLVKRHLNVTFEQMVRLVERPIWFDDRVLSEGKGADKGATRSLEEDFDLYLFNVHHLGYNYRHFGLIASSVRHFLSVNDSVASPELRLSLTKLFTALTIEGSARTLKNLVWAKLRESKSQFSYSTSTKLRDGVFNFFKDFLRSSADAHTKAWILLFVEVEKRFPKLLESISREGYSEALEKLGWLQFLKRFSSVSGVRFSERIMTPSSLHEKLFDSDVIGISTRTSMMGILEISASQALSDRSKWIHVEHKEKSVETARLIRDLSLTAIATIRKHVRYAPLIPNESLGQYFNSLGLIFYYGLGVQQDYAEALKWFRVGADHMFAPSQFYVGHMVKNGFGASKDYVESLKFLILAAKQGDTYSENAVGEAYENGLGVEIDLPEAVKWYRLAAKKGDPFAQNNLGLTFRRGRGVEKSYSEAKGWFELAANQGHSWAQYNLGEMYEKGQGCTVNYDEAIKWYRLAADQDNTWAYYARGSMYENGRGYEQSYTEARKWYRLAAERGNAWAQHSLGDLYQYGRGVEVDLFECFKWYKLSAEQGYSWAEYDYAMCLAEGKGCEKNLPEALKWFRIAASQGNAWAQFELGSHAEHVDGNLAEAMRWYGLSAGRHYEKARIALARLGF